MNTEHICWHDGDNSGEAVDDVREAQAHTDAVNTPRTKIKVELRDILAGCQAKLVCRARVKVDIIPVGCYQNS